jgi:hypothetical protein
MLGLASDPTHPFALFYLWYDTGLPDAQAHRDEVALFAEQVRGDGVVFLAHTYQEIFESMAKDFEPMTGWHAYFSGRYIHGATAVSRQTGSNTDEDRKKGVGLEGKDDAW